MGFYGIFAAFIIAMFLTLLFSSSFRQRGPWGGLLLFFLVIFLASWAAQLWISPVGPVIFGISWIPLVFVAVLFAIILLAAAATVPSPPKNQPGEITPADASFMAIGTFFWFLLIILLIAIAVGYYNSPNVKIISGQEIPAL